MSQQRGETTSATTGEKKKKGPGLLAKRKKKGRGKSISHFRRETKNNFPICCNTGEKEKPSYVHRRMKEGGEKGKTQMDLVLLD